MSPALGTGFSFFSSFFFEEASESDESLSESLDESESSESSLESESAAAFLAAAALAGVFFSASKSSLSLSSFLRRPKLKKLESLEGRLREPKAETVLRKSRGVPGSRDGRWGT